MDIFIPIAWIALGVFDFWMARRLFERTTPYGRFGEWDFGDYLMQLLMILLSPLFFVFMVAMWIIYFVRILLRRLG